MIGKTAFLTFKSKKAAQNLFFQSKKCFVVSDKIDIGHGDKIPLWLFGLLY
jgi:hypothetical protein